MDQNSSSFVFDADHDIPRRVAEPVSASKVRASQRLVVNPILAILTVLLAVSLIHHALRTRNLLLFVAALGLLVCAVPLFQFHCLDCGAVGWYLHSGRHACGAVLGRCGRDGQSPGGVRPSTQYLLWHYAMGLALLGYALFRLLGL